MREALTPGSKASGGLVGTSVKRVEDKRLLIGEGRFIDDLVVAGMAHAVFVRSPFPHATIVSIDVSAAEALPGVVAVMTGPELAEITNPFLPLSSIDKLYNPLFGPLAVDRVRHVGDPVAIVIAESRRVGEDAAELVAVDYEPLEPISSIVQALNSSREPIWPKAKSNVMFDHTDTFGDIDGVFTNADRIITESFSCHRQSNQPMETRGCVAEMATSGDGEREMVFHATTQTSHALRWVLAMSTERQSALASMRSLAHKRDKLKRFGAGAKAFATEKKDELGKSDNAGMLYQARKDPSTLKHMGRTFLNVLDKDPSEIPSVVADDIGGAFGVKGHPGREDVAVAAMARRLDRSIKWIEDRNEHLMVSGHAREEDMTIRLAVTNDGRLLGMDVSLVMNQGAYPAVPFGAAFFTRIMKVMFPGTYRWDAYRLRTRIVASNKAQYVAYRGPWANETWVRERMLDVTARALGLSGAEIRQRNMITMAELPTSMITGPTLDVRMSAHTTLERAIELADLEGFAIEQAKARSQGRYLGLGIATFHEAAPGPPDYLDHVLPGGGAMSSEPSSTVLKPDGRIAVITSQMPHGQSHETTMAQIAADQLGVGIESIDVVFGDTRRTTFTPTGTGGSRGGPMGGGSVLFSSRDLRRQILDEAADMLEAAVTDLEITDGNIHVVGVPAISKSFAEVAANIASAQGEALAGSVNYDGGAGGWSVATHVCWVDVDLATGSVAIPRYLVVEDCGELINPAIVEGQVRGGVAQGVGAVFYEHAAYTDEANFITGTFVDYLIPTSMEIPEIEIHHVETPSDVEANFRGVGEGGMIGAPAAITNAVEDALAHLGVRITEQHLPPTRILELAGIIEKDPV